MPLVGLPSALSPFPSPWAAASRRSSSASENKTVFLPLPKVDDDPGLSVVGHLPSLMHAFIQYGDATMTMEPEAFVIQKPAGMPAPYRRLTVLMYDISTGQHADVVEREAVVGSSSS
ncbi:hypothetical protein CDD80_6554 [Ophiocordyceps camponoti-rufipedis]|uniref:Uncharacterized protein n=1 Tax=Ophiocordyceps camponoti-rufipedis TaxID=2004952 RepID=A0A2C5YQ26_9HYPO|nr:hypothetical protein CDD80_6554 [Ophiocordyceps camponoti-rufipedis]